MIRDACVQWWYGIPDQARDVLAFIQSHKGSPPTGYKGGGVYDNDGRDDSMVLDRFDGAGNPITYQEYDVNPKPPAGQRRDTERIVVGSDGHMYYTSLHYRTFIEFFPNSLLEVPVPWWDD